MTRTHYHSMNLLDGFRFMFNTGPSYIVFHPTARCNCKCGFCFNWEGIKNAKKNKELALKEIKKVSQNLGYIKYLTISGGEPFLRNDISDICKMFHKNNKTKSIAIHTNCSFPERITNVVEDLLKTCPRLGLIICPSIDAKYKEHDKLRGHKDLFRKVEKTIDVLKSLQVHYKNLNITTVSVFFKGSESSILELSNFLEWKHGVKHSVAILRGDAKEKNLNPSFKAYTEYLQRSKLNQRPYFSNKEKIMNSYSSFANNLDIIKRRFIVHAFKTGKMLTPCVAGVKTVTILSDGKVAACEPFLNEKRFFMGDLRDFDYNMNRLLKSDTAQKVKDTIRSSQCCCTWECITPLNIISDFKYYPTVTKSYLTCIKSLLHVYGKTLKERIYRRFYLFSSKGRLVSIVNSSCKGFRVLLKSTFRRIRYSRKIERCDVLFLNPPRSDHILINNKSSKEEPLGMMSIAAFLKEKGFTTKIVDMSTEGVGNKSLISIVKHLSPKIIGIGTITLYANKAYLLGNTLKKYFPTTKIVYGGVHPTLFPKEPFEKGCADFVVIGEGEETMLELCNAVLNNHKPLSSIMGLAYKEGDDVKINKCRAFIQNLDKLPTHTYDTLSEDYDTNIHIPPFNKKRAFSIMTSRGCPYNCNYCGIPTIWKRKLRHRSPQHVLEEIKNAIKKYGVHRFHFYDDDFLLNKEFVKKFCNIITKEKLSIIWLCQSRTSSVVHNKSLIPLLKKAGCEVIELGIESCDEKVMQNMNKLQSTNDIKGAVEVLQQQNLKVLPLLMAFYPGEKLDSVYKTSELMINLGLWSNNKIEVYFRKRSPPECNGAPFVHGLFTTIIPGSGLYSKPCKEGVIFTRRWEDYSFNKVNFIPLSFLKDTPVRTSALGKEMFFQSIQRYENTITYYLAKRENVIGDFKSVKSYFEFLYALYKECDRNMTVEALCLKFAKRYDLIKICVALRFLAMFGFIRSRR